MPLPQLVGSGSLHFCDVNHWPTKHPLQFPGEGVVPAVLPMKLCRRASDALQYWFVAGGEAVHEGEAHLLFA